MRGLHHMVTGAGCLALTAALALTGCSANDLSTGSASAPIGSSTSPDLGAAGIQSVGPVEFERVIADAERVTINVHVPYEGEIAGTDVSIPFDQIEVQRDRLPSELHAPLAIYCRSDRMSAVAVQSLATLGYTDIVELSGGMIAWERSGRALVWR